MAAQLEVGGPGGGAVDLDGDRCTIGGDERNDLTVRDPQVSGVHAVLERYAAGWCVRDAGSTNGTFVNGERVWGERRLRSGDEIRLGDTVLVYQSGADAATPTSNADPAPQLTPREHDVLVALCRPVLSGDVFSEPASMRDAAAELEVTEAAVKQHLVNLYAKFGIEGSDERRRVRLANEAIRRGSVSLADLRADGSS